MINEESINKYVIIISMLCSFGVAFTSNAVSIALPTIAIDFNITNIMQNWLVNLYLLVIASTCVPFSKLCSRYGLNRTLESGIIIYIIGSIMSGIAFDITFLLFSRLIQGIGSAVLFVNGVTMITAQIPPQKRGQAIGLSITGVYLGLTLAPTVGGVLVQHLSWRSVFYITLPLILISYYLLRKIDKEWVLCADEPFDVKGSVLYLVGIIILMYGFTKLNSLIGIITVIIGLLILILFAKFELKTTCPIYNMHLFKNSKYTFSNIASLISYFATFVVTYILNYHLQYLNGFDPQTAGFILIITPLLMAICAPFAGRLSDKINPQILAAIGMSIVSVALLLLCFLNEQTPLYMIIISMVLQGIGFGLFSTSNNTVIMGTVPKKDIATASASLSTVRTIGQSFSLGLLTLIFALIMGNVPIIPETFPALIKSSQVTMTISTILCVLAIILSLMGIKSKNEIH